MKPLLKIIGGSGAALGVILPIVFQTSYDDVSKNVTSYGPLFSWLPQWLGWLLAQPLVPVIAASILAFALGRWWERRQEDASASEKPSYPDLGFRMLDFLDVMRGRSEGFAAGYQGELNARVNIMSNMARALGVTFPTDKDIGGQHFDLSAYYAEIGQYLVNGQVELAKTRSSIIVKRTGQLA